jgi:hypothetical protein
MQANLGLGVVLDEIRIPVLAMDDSIFFRGLIGLP